MGCIIDFSCVAFLPRGSSAEHARFSLAPSFRQRELFCSRGTLIELSMGKDVPTLARSLLTRDLPRKIATLGGYRIQRGSDKRGSRFTLAWSIALIFGILVSGCGHYPKGLVTRPVDMPQPQTPTIVVVAYGDTRTGPWGTGDNSGQAIHSAVVDDIFQNVGKPDAVIFTGDAVMSNFPLWKDNYWRAFFTSANRFAANGIAFYPSLGNHEVLPGAIPLMQTEVVPLDIKPGALSRTASVIDQQKQVAKAYELGEEPGQERPAQIATTPQIDPSSASGKRQLKEWEKGANKGDPASAHKIGQFERNLQSSFYSRNEPSRVSSDAGIFRQDYLNSAKYSYLRPLVHDKSYYSTVLQRGSVSLTLIALDTNILDSPEQRAFFSQEVAKSKGPIIVFGHHPPTDANHRSPWPWDMVPGWDDPDGHSFFKEYITQANPDGRKIVLWVFGHVHDYQRRSATQGAIVVAPVLLVAGGGGAPLDATAASFQWQPPSWAPLIQMSSYSHVKLSITATSVSVEVRGTDRLSSPFGVIDSFSIKLP